MDNLYLIRKQVFAYVLKKYHAKPEYLWLNFPNFAILRHDDNRKWFAAIMDITRDKLGLDSTERVDVLNVKVNDRMLIDILVELPGYYRGYHMSKGNWISILLDGSVPLEEITERIDESFLLTAAKKKTKKPPKLNRKAEKENEQL